MLAAWYEQNGAARDVLRVGEQPDPLPGKGDVRVRLRASGLNPSDVKARGGSRPVMPPRVIPNSDGAGTIDRVGAGVSRRRIGQRVWVYNGQWQRPSGTSAQYIALPAALAVPLPRKLSYQQGACLGIPVMTAHRCLFADGPIRGMNVLVTGGAGVVGHYAVQLARWAGAKVIATVSSQEKASHARKAGAHAVIDYRSENVGARLRELTGGAGVDRVVDVEFGANLPEYVKALRPDAVVATYASMKVPAPTFPFYELMRLNFTLRMVFVYTMLPAAKARALADIARWISTGRPKFAIAACFPLEEIVAAHELVESGAKTGHVIIDIP
ncbi:MAG TPA: NADPH:quinone reductase [Burkholderiales bacterium]|jgi:NADPH2:quinone reductase|nr:NADPH:quinone reductase [Burkholderiales bacterium]